MMVKDDYLIALDVEPKPSDMQTMVKGLTEYNAAQVGGETPSYLVATVRDRDGVMLGGLLGATYLSWLQIQIVWLPENLRGFGHGRALMNLAEAEGKRRGCKNAFLETYSFQALDFYKTCGYTVFSKLENMPPGGARYALTKILQRLE